MYTSMRRYIYIYNYTAGTTLLGEFIPVVIREMHYKRLCVMHGQTASFPLKKLLHIPIQRNHFSSAKVEKVKNIF